MNRRTKKVLGVAAGIVVVAIVVVLVGTQTGLFGATAGEPPGEPGEEGELAGYERQLQKVMDEVFRVLESIERRQDLGEDAKKQKALEFLRNVRWGPEKKDYFWVNDLQGRMLMDPYIPDLEGKIMLGYEDPDGTQPFAEFVRIAEEQDQGFLDY